VRESTFGSRLPKKTGPGRPVRAGRHKIGCCWRPAGLSAGQTFAAYYEEAGTLCRDQAAARGAIACSPKTACGVWSSFAVSRTLWAQASKKIQEIAGRVNPWGGRR